MESVPANATHAPEGTSLAYEHLVNITLPGRDIPAGVTAVQTSCSAKKFGDCAVLNVQQQGGEFPSGTEMGGSDIGQAFRDSGQILATSTAWLIRAVAFLIPLLIVFWAVVAVRRWRSRAKKSVG